MQAGHQGCSVFAMSKRKKPKRRPLPVQSAASGGTNETGLATLYHRACELAQRGDYTQARHLYESIVASAENPALEASAHNDLAVLTAVAGDLDSARQTLTTALARDPACETARHNAALLEADLRAWSSSPQATPTQTLAAVSPLEAVPVKVAILSFLFNWPSTGGGNVHTAELALFLGRAGYDVRHFFIRYAPWHIGNVTNTPFPSQPLDFDEINWNVPAIQRRVRQAVDEFKPDHVLITDSWNVKPVLAEAVAGYPFILRFQAMECLCPLNNVRLLPGPGGQVRQCGRHQLATPEVCAGCLRDNGRHSGALHQAERALSGVETPGYQERLRRCMTDAEAVLVVNPLTEAMLSPYARSVRVVTAGMDPARFAGFDKPVTKTSDQVKSILFAGLVEEWMKGFHILQEACVRLWQKRQDFEVVATGDPPGRVDPFTRFIGWQSQEDLPRHLHAADMLVMPTIAQEALGRTAVEAMAAGRPVVASRLGGLPTTVADGATGLLCEPGDAADLARKIEMLLDDPELRQRMGRAGRRRFEEHYSWEVIIERHYKPLLGPPSRAAADRNGFVPRFPEHVDEEQLVDEASRFFAQKRPDVEHWLRVYRQAHAAKDYARKLGEFKTLCFSEAFVLFVLISLTRPRTMIEVGTGEGKSTRRILDMMTLLGHDGRVVCFDPEPRVQHFTPREATVVTRDITGRFRQEVLEPYARGLVFLDVHTYPRLHEAIHQTMAHPGQWMLAVHDCGRGLCNPHMTLAREDPNVTSATGVWERHVLAELFDVHDPLSTQLDEAQSTTHRLRIFDTTHGLAVIVPKDLLPRTVE
jgi:glycosyltransferase involved in cell wall biosynthesis